MKTRRHETISGVPEDGNKNIMGKMKNGRGFGSPMMAVAVFICVQLLSSSSVEAQPTTIRPTTVPCSRLLMKGIDNDNLPWLQMAGIYHLADFTVDFFPVYKHELINLHFYYNHSMKELRFGTPYQNTSILVGAYTNGNTDSVTDNYTKPFNPFYSMITGWYQYDPASLRYVALSGGNKSIEPTCITDDVVTCSSGMVEFDENLKQIHAYNGAVTDINILGLDYYKQIPEFYLNNRPVYTRMRGDIDTRTYLYYMRGRWLIDEKFIFQYRPTDFNTDSSAMRPEHVHGKWNFKTKGKFITVDAKLRCRALAADKTCGASPADQCLNGGTCLTSSDGVKKYCGCASGYRGLYCEEQIPSCPEPTELIDLLSTIEGGQPYFVPSFYEGSVLTIFRSLGSRPSYWFSTCDGITWSKANIDIPQPTFTIPTTTTTYREYTTRRYIFFWDDAVATAVVAVMVMAMQVINPLIIWCVIHCVSIGREIKDGQNDDEKLQNLNTNYQTSLDTFRQNHPEPEEEYDAVTATQLSKIHEDDQRQRNEITERKEVRKNKSLLKVKLSRVFSIYAYFTFWIFLFYTILVFTTRLFGGAVFVVLGVISSVFIFTSHLIVVLEYKWSSERQYIKNLSSSVFAVQRIEAIRVTRPSIYLRAVCYHYETRTRLSTYTDANGNLQTRLETYQEQIVTNRFIEGVRFQYWRDTSTPELVGINDKCITKIKMTLSVEPGDEETRLQFDNQYQAFKDRYENKDVHVDFSMDKEVEGFEKRLAAYTDNRQKPAWVSSAWFMAASFLFFSWPYRWVFNSITCKTEFAVRKRVYLNRPEEDNNLPGINCCIMTGNDDSGGEHFEADSTAVTVDSDDSDDSDDD